MKKLEDFKNESVDLRRLYGAGPNDIEYTYLGEPCQDYWYDHNCNGRWDPGEPGGWPCPDTAPKHLTMAP